MKKASFISTFVASLAIAVIIAPAGLSQDDIQLPLDGVIPKAKLSAGKGEYGTFVVNNTGVSPTATQTVTGTVAVMKVSANGLFATTTATTVTSTVDKKSIVKSKLGNRELLALILDTDDKKIIGGHDLVWITNGGDTVVDGVTVAARDKSTGVITARVGDQLPSVEGGGGFDFFTNKVAGKEPGSFRQSGYGDGVVGAEFDTGAGIIDIGFFALLQFKEETTYNAAGEVTNRTKPSVKSVSAFGGSVPVAP
jgi:hypothetical protein